MTNTRLWTNKENNLSKLWMTDFQIMFLIMRVNHTKPLLMITMEATTHRETHMQLTRLSKITTGMKIISSSMELLTQMQEECMVTISKIKHNRKTLLMGLPPLAMLMINTLSKIIISNSSSKTPTTLTIKVVKMSRTRILKHINNNTLKSQLKMSLLKLT